VELTPVEVTVLSLDLVEFRGTAARILVHCSAGTYMRSIAHDLGRALGCGAFIERLRRTASGEFTESQARSLEELDELARSGRLVEALIPASQVLPHLPAALVDAQTAGSIRQGKDFRLSPFRPSPNAKVVRAINETGDLVAIGEARLPHLYHPIVVL
jgi:tRNA pseudouridine55 synthase